MRLAVYAVFFVAATASAQPKAPLLSAPVIDALAKELSGDRALETVKGISSNHRVRGSRPFRAAAELIAGKARAAGLDSVRIEEFPADGKIFYGTQRSRPPWDAEFAELREGDRVVASWDKQPMSLAEDSESGDVTAELVDVGAGAAESDYAGKNVKGKLILASSQADGVAEIGVAKHGAAGIISYAQNQQTGWWGENTELVRWGHLDSFAPFKTFAFMISPAMAKSYKDRLARGEKISMHAVVRAGQHAGGYSVVTAMIRGADPKLAQEEIVFSCHLDHPNPGANDNASGCATILEAGVTLSKLIRDGKIPRPARTIRFVWPPEVEGTMAILNAKPEWAKRIKAVIHMDMVGGGPETKSVFHVSAGPGHLPSFVYAVGQAFGAWVNAETYRYAATGSSAYPLISPAGGKEPLLAALDEYDMGSDHDVYQEASWNIPAIYLHDWPDRYIHTTQDTPDKIDPTKLLRAAFIGAASGYFLSGNVGNAKDIGLVLVQSSSRRALLANERTRDLSAERPNLNAFNAEYTRLEFESMKDFDLPDTKARKEERPIPRPLFYVPGDAGMVFKRNPEVRGPMSVFGYNYLTARLGSDKAAALKLLQYEGLWGASGDHYAYEVLNLVNGTWRVYDIRNYVSAVYGPVPIDFVVEYLRALEKAGVVTAVKQD
ncbi:MAG TPA: M28 family peptidase [Gemmatimonadaceae bacterium]|nr:M28 family peptidase [Gemmatimonadaceae bacterium]